MSNENRKGNDPVNEQDNGLMPDEAQDRADFDKDHANEEVAASSISSDESENSAQEQPEQESGKEHLSEAGTEEPSAADVVDDVVLQKKKRKFKWPWVKETSNTFIDENDGEQLEQADGKALTADAEPGIEADEQMEPLDAQPNAETLEDENSQDKADHQVMIEAVDGEAETAEEKMAADKIDVEAPKKKFVFRWPWSKKNADAASGEKKPRKPWSVKKKVIVSIAAALLIFIIASGVYAYSIWSNPMGQFETVAQQVTPVPVATETQAVEATPTPTIDPYEELAAQADWSVLTDIVNIMLIGVDHSTEREADDWTGKDSFHSDVMIVLAVNTTTKEVSMISLPRDTYAKIPGVSGIYKLNAAIDCGGGWPTPGGFEKVCEAASWMLGAEEGQNIIPYYYAVDMNAVKGLVDAIGGVDFDLDIDFNLMGRYYEAGYQHMDGQAVLDYLRVRKEKNLPGGQTGDLNRVDRQKRMLVAIYEKLKESNLLATLPQLIEAFDGNLYTNTTLAQTAALAAYAYQVPSENISMYSMGGSYHYGIFNWNFVITDQKARVELIEKVYGVEVSQYKKYASSYAEALWAKMQAEVLQDKAEPILQQVKAILDADAQLPVYVEPTPEPSPTETPTETPTATPTDEETPTETPTATPTDEETPTDQETPTDEETPTDQETPTDEDASSGSGTTSPMLAFKFVNVANTVTTVELEGEYRQYFDDVWALYNQAADEVNRVNSIDSTSEKNAVIEQARADVETLCGMFGIAVPDWDVHYETKSNEIYVDFR